MTPGAAPRRAVDGEEHVYERTDERGTTVVAWYPAGPPPAGMPFGATAVCVAEGGGVVLIREDGTRWDFPGGRPEPGESWEQTMRREILEEACATVLDAQLLGYCRFLDTDGPEAAVVKVRSMWRAAVRLSSWEPRFEVQHRQVVDAARVVTIVDVPPGVEPIYVRFLHDAGVID